MWQVRVKLLLLLLTLLLIHVTICLERKNWDQILSDVDKDWEKGDEEEELEYEFERNRKLHGKMMPKVDMNDGAAIIKEYKKNPLMFTGGGGQVMIFVELKKEERDKQAMDQIAGRWSALLRSASVPITCYNTGENSILVSLEKGWLGKDVLKFLSIQPEVDTFNVNNKTYKPGDFDEDEDDEE